MKDEKLFELAVNITTAKIQNGTIPPGARVVDDMIDDHVTATFQRLRRIWREYHQEDNIHAINPSSDPE